MVAIITLLLCLELTPKSSVKVVQWCGVWKIFQAFLWITATGIVWLAMRILGFWDFLGLTAFRLFQRRRRKPGVLLTYGIYAEVRHPLFLAGLLILWARDLSAIDLVVTMILSAYLVLGARIEERRLLKEFGLMYARYMNIVPGLVPRRIPHFGKLIQESRPRYRHEPENTE